MREFWHILVGSIGAFGEQRVPQKAAALAYYTVFSLAPLLIVLIGVIGLVYGSQEAREQLVSQLQVRVGAETASLVDTMVERTASGGSGLVAMIVGLVTLLVGATGVFVQLQLTMNELWGVAADKSGGMLRLVLVRLKSLGMVLLLGLLLLASFALQAGLNIVLSNYGGTLPGSEWFWYLLNLVLTLALLALVFAGLFKMVPDVHLSWSDVWRGALLTAVLFKIGETVIGIYLGISGVRTTYGAAGSLVVLLLWIYLSAQIVLFGVQFTRVERRRSAES